MTGYIMLCRDKMYIGTGLCSQFVHIFCLPLQTLGNLLEILLIMHRKIVDENRDFSILMMKMFRS